MDQTRGIGTAKIAATMVDPELVRHLHAPHELGWGAKRIAWRVDAPRGPASGGAAAAR